MQPPPLLNIIDHQWSATNNLCTEIMWKLINLLLTNNLHDLIMQLEKNNSRQIIIEDILDNGTGVIYDLLHQFIQYPKLKVTRAGI